MRYFNFFPPNIYTQDTAFFNFFAHVEISLINFIKFSCPNKIAPPFRTCEFDILYNEGISRYSDVVNAGVKYGVLAKAGSWYNYGEQKLGQGVEGSRQFLKENPKVEKEIVTKIKAAAVLEA